MNVFVLNTKEDILKNEGNRAVFSHTIEVNGAPKQPDYKLSSKLGFEECEFNEKLIINPFNPKFFPDMKISK